MKNQLLIDICQSRIDREEAFLAKQKRIHRGTIPPNSLHRLRTIEIFKGAIKRLQNNHVSP